MNTIMYISSAGTRAFEQARARAVTLIHTPSSHHHHPHHPVHVAATPDGAVNSSTLETRLIDSRAQCTVCMDKKHRLLERHLQAPVGNTVRSVFLQKSTRRSASNCTVRVRARTSPTRLTTSRSIAALLDDSEQWFDDKIMRAPIGRKES